MFKRTRSLLAIARGVDFALMPLTALAGGWLKLLRIVGLKYLPISKRTLMAIGVFPVRDHYYEPLINTKQLRHSLSDVRRLPAVDLNVREQLSMLTRFNYQEELKAFPLDRSPELSYYYHNASFEAGDAEYLYSFLRLMKPKKLVEIGSGFSTLMARNAIGRNGMQDDDYRCEHICVEPYEQPWLEKLDVGVIRRRVEECGVELFASLVAGDVLFIDSSHMIRPQGDVLFEYLELLPALRSGVFVHIHDIFTPRDYPKVWVVDENRLWNEQYLLEAFLSYNQEFKVIGALNFLVHNFPTEICEAFPVLKADIAVAEPGSFWMLRR